MNVDSPDKTLTRLIMFFILVAFSIASWLIFNAYLNFRETYESTADLIELQQQKRKYLTQMYNAARERSLILLKMLRTDDPFELDNLRMALQEQASLFIAARQTLMQLDLTAEEKIILEQQRQATAKNAPLQNHVADLIIEEKRDVAHSLLFRKALPSQDHILEFLNKILEKHDAHSLSLVTEIRSEFHKNSSNLLILWVVLSLVFIIIVFILLKTGSRREEQRLRHALDLAKQAARAKAVFLANMSHELRTPMNGVIATSELLAETRLDQEQTELVRIIIQSGNSMLSLINDILDLSKLESAKVQLEQIDFDLEQLLIESLTLLANNQKKIDLVLDYKPACPRHFLGDPIRIKQILLNLLGNACKFTHKGYIKCSVRCNHNNQLEIAVADTGIGIEDSQLKKIFDEFTQADSSTTRKYGGTGLGLSISLKLVKLMDGHIDVKSEVGKGTVFTVFLPLNRQLKISDKAEVGQIVPPVSGNCNNKVNIVMFDHTGVCCSPFYDFFQWIGLTSVCHQHLDKAITEIKSKILSDRKKIMVIFKQTTEPSINNAFNRQLLSIKKNAPERLFCVLLVYPGLVGSMIKREDYDLCIPQICSLEQMYQLLDECQKFKVTPSEKEKNRGDSKDTEKYSLAHSHAHILVADDVRMNQCIAEKILTAAGLKVSLADNGEQVLEKIRQHDFDLILMDCQMPVMDGYQASREIRKTEQDEKNTEHLPIIALTANATAEDRQKCLDCGMDDVITKPYKKNELLHCISRWIQRQPHRN